MSIRFIKIPIILLIAVLLSVFLFCGETAVLCNDSNETPPAAKSIEFSALINCNSDVKWGQGLISRQITKLTGVSLDFVYPAGSGENTAKIMLASDTYPDLLLSVDNNIISMYAQAGVLVPLDAYIYAGSGNILRTFGKDLDKMRYNGNGAIYGVNRNYKEITSASNAIFNIQYALLEEFGYPELKTLDDLYGYLLEYKNRYPAAGGEALIGFSFYTEGHGFNVTLSNATLQSGGYQNDGLFCVDDDLNVRYVILTDEAHRYFKWLNKLYLSGLLDDSALIQSKEVLSLKAEKGIVMAISAEEWDMESINSRIRANDLYDRCYAPFPLTLSEETESKASVYDPYGSWKSVITDNCRDAGAAFDFYDAMWEEEMQVLCNWGIEGVHYSVVDGARVVNDEIYCQRTVDSSWTTQTEIGLYDFWSYGENVVGSDGQLIVPNDYLLAGDAGTDGETGKVLKAYGIKTFKELCPAEQESQWLFAWKLALPYTSPGAVAERRMETLRRVIVPEIIMSNSDEEFEANWNELLRQAQEAGIEEREAEIHNALLNMRD